MANSNRAVFTMQDIIDTVDSTPGSPTIGGAITAGQIAFGAATANTIEGNASITTNGTNLFIPDFVVHTGNTDTFLVLTQTITFRLRPILTYRFRQLKTT